MRHIAFSGTWRYTTPELEADVRTAVQKVYADGDSIVVGAALGVDSLTLEEMLRLDPSGERLTVILVTSLDSYIKRVTLWVARKEQPRADERIATLINLMERLHATRPAIFVVPREIEPELITEEDYLSCNDTIVELSDELMAFQVNKSTGTQDAIDKMKAAGKSVQLHSYTI